MNIHPNIPCKYGFYCTRVNCAYSHNTGFNPGMYPTMMPGMPFGGQKFRNMKMDHRKKGNIVIILRRKERI